MTVLREGALELSLPQGAHGKRFDDRDHGLSYCMKAVDFIVEEPDETLFIEFKDPDHPHADRDHRDAFLNDLSSGARDDDLVRKYRDSFIYRWAQNVVQKPNYYCVLVASTRLDRAQLLARTEELQRILPVKGPASGAWQRQIVTGCGVFNLETWNEHLSRYPVRRMDP